MAAFVAWRRATLEGQEYLPMNEGFARAAVLGQFYNGISLVV